MDPFSVDAYTPAEIARRLEKISMSKCTVDPLILPGVDSGGGCRGRIIYW